MAANAHRFRRGLSALGLTAAIGWGCNVLTAIDDLRVEPDAGVTDGAVPKADVFTPPPPPDGGVVPGPDAEPPPDDAAADAPPIDAAAGDAGPRDAAGPLRVFVSSSVSTGNLGGVSAADDLCASLARAENLGGTWRAWLSTPTVAAFSRITASGPWVNMMGQTVAQSRLALSSGMLSAEIRYDEKGQNPAGTNQAFTGTQPDGTSSFFTCMAWTNGTANAGGAVGHSQRTGQSWTNDGVHACANQRRVYCFENGR